MDQQSCDVSWIDTTCAGCLTYVQRLNLHDHLVSDMHHNRQKTLMQIPATSALNTYGHSKLKSMTHRLVTRQELHACNSMSLRELSLSSLLHKPMTLCPMSNIACGGPANLGEFLPCLHGQRLDSHVVYVRGQFLAILGSCLL